MTVNLDQLHELIGEDLAPSSWILVDQEMISAFGRLTGDEQFIHMDPERARDATPFGGTIAHGFLTLSLASRMALEAQPKIQGQTMGVNYGFDRVRFLHPVASGKRVRGRFSLSEILPKGRGRVLLNYAFSIEIEEEETPALSAQWLTLFYFEEDI
ncbi:MaoC family dehydratase [Pseudovibrio exalbescens]|uniref:Nodulation protein NodN n=1 Tax=Pseudovibrio exalbescens TaxID=197461 RepID=A0A1U7JM08_9HYPH|nr:MaoC family dehydratase [Pseudovibrio exalbescens]OKL45786.1 nodulation protein NodN [Pseudovibrio exalbescens]